MSPAAKIPAFLCGHQRDVRKESRKVCKRAISLGSIARAVEGMEFVPVGDTPGEIIFGPPHRSVELEHVIPSPFMEFLLDTTYTPDRGKWYDDLRGMMWDALDQFWFCLCVLSSTGYVLPIKTPYDDDGRRADDSRTVLRKLLRWWPDFCELDGRFYNDMLMPEPGYRWGRGTWDFLRAIGQEHVISDLKKVDPEDAGLLIARAVSARG